MFSIPSSSEAGFSTLGTAFFTSGVSTADDGLNSVGLNSAPVSSYILKVLVKAGTYSVVEPTDSANLLDESTFAGGGPCGGGLF